MKLNAVAILTLSTYDFTVADWFKINNIPDGEEWIGSSCGCPIRNCWFNCRGHAWGGRLYCSCLAILLEVEERKRDDELEELRRWLAPLLVPEDPDMTRVKIRASEYIRRRFCLSSLNPIGAGPGVTISYHDFDLSEGKVKLKVEMAWEAPSL